MQMRSGVNVTGCLLNFLAFLGTSKPYVIRLSTCCLMHMQAHFHKVQPVLTARDYSHCSKCVKALVGWRRSTIFWCINVASALQQLKSASCHGDTQIIAS